MGNQFINTHKYTSALLFFNIWERNKDESINFNWQRAWKDKLLNDLLSLMSQNDQITTLDDLGKKDY